MQFNLNKHKNDLIFLPLGGSGEIGMNFNLYYYQGKWLIVDCGCGFAEDYLPGVDMIVPDISYIMKHKKNIAGMVLTHSHEDHLGAVQYLWEALECPIYASRFTSAFLHGKLHENGVEHSNDIFDLPIQGKVKIGPFNIETVPLSHSIPEMQALVIKTHLGNVFHTGDWKFDSNPVIGEVNDEQLLADYGNRGVLAVVGDSTNVFNTDPPISESKLKESLTDLVASCKKMLIVTTFASNVGRLETLIKAGHRAGRKVALSGRSLKRILAAAQETGYLQDIPELVDEKDVGKYERSKIMIISTGCQGEPLAAMTKIANQTHPKIKIANGDTVIFSSKIIPGNDKKIYRLFNNLVKLGVEVFTEKDHFVHISGHPGKEELKRLYKLLKPNTLIPVHGEHVHMHEHVKLGKSLGIKHNIEVENGTVVKLAPDAPQKIGKVESGELAVYGSYFIKPDSGIMKVRRNLRNDGIVIATIVISKKQQLAVDPIIIAPGYLDEVEDMHLIYHIQDEVRILVEGQVMSKKKKVKAMLADLQKIIKSRIKSILKREVEKIPTIQVIIRVI
jgi:ribonuclease J